MQEFIKKYQGILTNITMGFVLPPLTMLIGNLYKQYALPDAEQAALLPFGLLIIIIGIAGYWAIRQKLLIVGGECLATGMERKTLPKKISLLNVLHGFGQMSIIAMGMMIASWTLFDAGLSDNLMTVLLVVVLTGCMVYCFWQNYRFQRDFIAQDRPLSKSDIQKAVSKSRFLIESIIFIWAATGAGLLWGGYGMRLLDGLDNFSIGSVLLVGCALCFLFLFFYMPWRYPYYVAQWMRRRSDTRIKEMFLTWGSLLFVFLMLFIPMLHTAYSEYHTRTPLPAWAQEPGARVYAYWEPDGWYYYGIISNVEDNQVEVVFYDQTRMALPPDAVYRSKFNPDLWEVQADYNSNNYFEPVTILRYERFTGWVVVDDDGNEYSVQEKQFRLRPPEEE